MLSRFRNHARLLARFNLALFALVWMSTVAAPCAMAMHAEPVGSIAHDCPHCPPRPCEEVDAIDCDAPDLDLLVSVDKTLAAALATPATHPTQWAAGAAGVVPVSVRRLPARSGPRAHLLHAQFNE